MPLNLAGLPRAGVAATVAMRFWNKVDIKGSDECWPWTGGLDKKKVYGQFKGHPWSRQAHRIALMLRTGERLPREIVAHHTCHERPDHTPLCCNPAHLEPMDDAAHRSMHATERWAAHKAGAKPFRKPTGMR